MDFDDPRWSDLEAGHRMPCDPRNALWGDCMTHRSIMAVLAALLSASPPAFGQEKDLLNDDKALIQFVMPKNWEFGRVLDPCNNLKVHRFLANGMRLFRINGVCGIKNALAPDEDCYGYSLEASGTIDTATNATIRKITLKLLCSA